MIIAIVEQEAIVFVLYSALVLVCSALEARKLKFIFR